MKMKTASSRHQHTRERNAQSKEQRSSVLTTTRTVRFPEGSSTLNISRGTERMLKRSRPHAATPTGATAKRPGATLTSIASLSAVSGTILLSFQKSFHLSGVFVGVFLLGGRAPQGGGMKETVRRIPSLATACVTLVSSPLLREPRAPHGLVPFGMVRLQPCLLVKPWMP